MYIFNHGGTEAQSGSRGVARRRRARSGGFAFGKSVFCETRSSSNFPNCRVRDCSGKPGTTSEERTCGEDLERKARPRAKTMFEMLRGGTPK